MPKAITWPAGYCKYYSCGFHWKLLPKLLSTHSGGQTITQIWTLYCWLFPPLLFLLLLAWCYFCLTELHDSSRKFTDQKQDESKTFLIFLSHFWNTGLSNLIQNTQDFCCKETWAARESWKHGTGNMTQVSWSELLRLWLWTQSFLTSHLNVQSTRKTVSMIGQ